MNNSKIIMVKLYNGDFIIGSVDDSIKDDSKTYLNDPRSFMMMPTMTGELRIALRPICSPFNSARLKKGCEIRNDQIMFTLDEDEIDNELINGYKSEISGIKIASAAQTASINATPASDSPKEFII